MKTKIILSSLALFACVGVSESLGQGFQSLPVAIKPAGVLVVIDGRAYYWSGEGTFVENPNEGATIKREALQWWNRKLPPLRDSDKKVEIIAVMGSADIPGYKGVGYYLRVGGHRYLSVDDEGHVTVITVMEKKNLTDRSAWVEKETGGQNVSDDVITEYEFTHPGAPKDKQHLGIGDEPLVLKDKDDKEHKFFPLILTEPKKAAHFLINDESGK